MISFGISVCDPIYTILQSEQLGNLIQTNLHVLRSKTINLGVHALILQHSINRFHGTFLYALTFGENLMDYGNYKEPF